MTNTFEQHWNMGYILILRDKFLGKNIIIKVVFVWIVRGQINV